MDASVETFVAKKRHWCVYFFFFFLAIACSFIYVTFFFLLKSALFQIVLKTEFVVKHSMVKII